MLRDDLEAIQFTTEEDTDSIQIMISTAILEEQVPSILEKIRVQFIHIQKKPSCATNEKEI